MRCATVTPERGNGIEGSHPCRPSMAVPSYYPRHGCDAHLFGRVCMRFAMPAISNEAGILEVQPLMPDDVDAVRRIRGKWDEGIPLAPGPGGGTFPIGSPSSRTSLLLFQKQFPLFPLHIHVCPVRSILTNGVNSLTENTRRL